MAQPNVYGTAVMISPEAQMARIGIAMKDYAKFWWIGICLFWLLLIPLIMLIVKYVKLIQELQQMQKVAPNPDLNHAVQGIILGICLNLIGLFLFGSAGFFALEIVAFVFEIWAYVSLEKWAITISQLKQTPNTANFSKAMGDLKIAYICCIILIGFFMIPGALHRGADALYAEYGSYLPPGQGAGVFPQQSSATPAGQTYAQPQGYAPPSQGYAPQPQPMTYGAPITVTPIINAAPGGVKFCPNCGTQLPTPEAKFCGKCGNKIDV